jgi:rod shape-determining protein MreC
VAVLSLASIAMMTVDHRQHHMDDVRNALAYVVYPIQYLVSLPGRAGQWLSEALATRRMLERENAALSAQHLLLESKLLKLEALEAENSRLRALFDSTAQIDQRLLISELISVDMAPFSRQFVLNKGSAQGIHEGQPILDAYGVMGQVVQVTPLTSTAMLITDPNHALPVEVNRNGLRSVARGTSDPSRLELFHLPSNADIATGDLLVTSGLDGRFPPGYPVAYVTRIEKQPDSPFAIVSAEPTAHLEHSRVVLLVLSEETPPAVLAPANTAPAAGAAAAAKGGAP